MSAWDRAISGVASVEPTTGSTTMSSTETPSDALIEARHASSVRAELKVGTTTVMPKVALGLSGEVGSESVLIFNLMRWSGGLEGRQ